MWAFAVSEMRERNLPALPGLMHECECDILNYLSSAFPPSVHGYNSMIIAGFFHAEFLNQALSNDDKLRLYMHIHVGSPLLRAAHDGSHRRPPTSNAATTTRASVPAPHGGHPPPRAP